MCKKISLPNEILLLDELTPSMLDVYVSVQILTKNGRNCHIKVSQIEKLLGNKDNTNHRYIINNLQKLNDLGVIFFEKVGRKISVSFAEISKKFTKIETEDYFAIAKGKSRLLFCYLETLRKNKRIQIAKTGLEKLSCLLKLNFELPAYVIRKQVSRHLRRLSDMLSFKIENNVFFFQFTEKSTENDTKPPKINDCSDSSNAENAQKTENLIESWPPSQDVDTQQTPVEITPETGDLGPDSATTKVATKTMRFSQEQAEDDKNQIGNPYSYQSSFGDGNMKQQISKSVTKSKNTNPLNYLNSKKRKEFENLSKENQQKFEKFLEDICKINIGIDYQQDRFDLKNVNYWDIESIAINGQSRLSWALEEYKVECKTKGKDYSFGMALGAAIKYQKNPSNNINIENSINGQIKNDKVDDPYYQTRGKDYTTYGQSIFVDEPSKPKSIGSIFSGIFPDRKKQIEEERKRTFTDFIEKPKKGKSEVKLSEGKKPLDLSGDEAKERKMRLLEQARSLLGATQ